MFLFETEPGQLFDNRLDSCLRWDLDSSLRWRLESCLRWKLVVV